MSRTEDRLTDALGAVGRTARDEDLRPLGDLETGSAHRGQARWRRWLAPAAAAAAVVVIAGLAVSPVFRHGPAAGARGSRHGAPASASSYSSFWNQPRCSPQVVAATSGGPASDHTRTMKQVASGISAGHSWTVWVKKGLSEPAALEDGGLVLSGRWYGMCAGDRNPLAAELVDEGVRGIAYGYLADPGPIRLSMTPAYARHALTTVRLPGVSVFVAALPESACAYHSVTLRASASAQQATDQLQLGTCQPGHVVAITGGSGSWTASLASMLGCNPSTTRLDSGGSSALRTAGEVKVASGTIGGRPWSLWSAKGIAGAGAIKNGGLVLSGRWYGLCSFMQNPAEFELIDVGPAGVVYGYVASPLRDAVRLIGPTSSQRLPAPAAVRVQGGTFFIGLLPRSACDYPSMTLQVSTTRRTDSAYLSLRFASCRAGHLVTIHGSSGGTAGDDW
jgi:hypothetical protein